MVNVNIDGQMLEANAGDMIIQVADKAGSYIPRFCYHEKLSIAANCRMCLVEVEGIGKTLPACATPVAEGMKVFTRSPKALEAQRHIMEFLLINHPLDCPVCDQGGQCELQDLAMDYGEGVSQYNQGKRSVKDKDIGPLIDTEMTRCIYCTRCVRFGTEVAGIRELGLTGRGENTEVGTYVAKLVGSEVSGNVIDLCPVGALNAKPSAKQGRAWHLAQHAGLAMHDCLAAPVYWHTDKDDYGHAHIVQTVPRASESGEHCWIADRDRFSYLGLGHEDRLTSPMIKKKGVWCDVSWQEALTQVAAVIERTIADDNGGDSLAALASPSESMESLYMLQKLWRSLGSSHIDHRYRRSDFSDQASDSLLPGLGFAAESLVSKQAIWLVDCDLPRECPVLGLHARQASLQGCNVMSTATSSYAYPMEMTIQSTCAKHALLEGLAKVLLACYETRSQTPEKDAAALLKDIQTDADSRQIAKQLCDNEAAVIIVGLKPQSDGHYAQVNALLQHIAELSGAHLGCLTHGSNAAGAASVGFLPHRGVGGHAIEHPGQNAKSMWATEKKVVCLFNVAPESDSLYGQDILTALQSAHCVIACTSYANETMQAVADILLPVASVGESSGSCINAEGQEKVFASAADLPGYARPAWKVFRALGSTMQLSGFDHMTLDDVRDAMANDMKKASPVTPADAPLPASLPTAHKNLHTACRWPIYAVDAVVRRASALQQAYPEQAKALYVASDVAEGHALQSGDSVQITQGEKNTVLSVWVDEAMPAQTVCLPLGIPETQGFGVGEVQLQKGEAHV